ncbi:MAG: thiamine-phosphate kinase [Nitrospirae bacterium]|nr:thiamine-phosphate kinase [Nitrospirota bacterium]
MTVEAAGESALVGLIRRVQGESGPTVIKGIGDDAAVYAPPEGVSLASADMLIEGVHFDPATTTPFQLGYKCVTVNLSDIRAMAGVPRYILVSSAIPGGMDVADLEEIFTGMKAACSKYGVDIIGGDTCRSPHGLTISVTVIGDAHAPVYRSGARPGDALFLSGPTGDSALGLEILKRVGKRMNLDCPESLGLPPEISGSELSIEAARALRRHLMPEPVMRDFHGATAMIDISDGLLLDLSRLCAESGVGAVVNMESIRLSPQLNKLAPLLGLDALTLALSGGEDYELLFAAPADAEFNGAVRIGRIVEKPGIFSDDECRQMVQPAGYDHFA